MLSFNKLFLRPEFEVVKPEFRKNPGNDITIPTRGSITSAGYDFYLPYDVVIPAGEQKLIWTDVKAKMRVGQVLLVFPRSSHGTKLGLVLANTVGVVDSDYYENVKNDGNIGICLKNAGNEEVVFKAGERISQGVFFKFAKAINGNSKKKRSGGFGSTNK